MWPRDGRVMRSSSRYGLLPALRDTVGRLVSGPILGCIGTSHGLHLRTRNPIYRGLIPSLQIRPRAPMVSESGQRVNHLSSLPQLAVVRPLLSRPFRGLPFRFPIYQSKCIRGSEPRPLHVVRGPRWSMVQILCPKNPHWHCVLNSPVQFAAAFVYSFLEGSAAIGVIVRLWADEY